MIDTLQRSTRRTFLRRGAVAGLAAVAGCVGRFDPDDGHPEDVAIEHVVDGLTHPWAIAFLPGDSRMLVTERVGELHVIDREDGSSVAVEGTPEVFAEGQGGLLDIALHPDFLDTFWVYLTYSATNEAGSSATHLGRGRLDPDAAVFEEFEILFVVKPFIDSTKHYGSRILFDDEGSLYMTSGDRGIAEFGPEHVAQDTSNELGATLRFNADGTIPQNNPFVGEPGASDAIFSYGHRNAQGMTINPASGELWQAEHGEQDGDRINIIEAGGNYGWPIAHSGCTYGSGEPIGEPFEERDDVVDPVHAWECDSGGFPPAGATFYTGEAFPDWENDLFVGTLAGEYLGRFRVDGTDVEEVDQLLDGEGWRLRDVAVAPDTGHLYVAVDAASAPLVRLVPP